MEAGREAFLAKLTAAEANKLVVYSNQMGGWHSLPDYGLSHQTIVLNAVGFSQFHHLANNLLEVIDYHSQEERPNGEQHHF